MRWWANVPEWVKTTLLALVTAAGFLVLVWLWIGAMLLWR